MLQAHTLYPRTAFPMSGAIYLPLVVFSVLAVWVALLPSTSDPSRPIHHDNQL
jgi:hypothetical protein